MIPGHRHRALDRGLVAREDDLAGIVVVGDLADLTLRGGFGQRRGLVDVGAEQRAHRALADRHRRLHRQPAQAQQPRGIGQGEGAGGA